MHKYISADIQFLKQTEHCKKNLVLRYPASVVRRSLKNKKFHK